MEKNCTKCKHFNKLTDTIYTGICKHSKHVGRIADENTTCSEYEEECIIGIVDTKTRGREFAIGTKNHGDTFVLNFGDKSCLLFMGDITPIDLRKFNFDEFTSIEINGNKFVTEN